MMKDNKKYREIWINCDDGQAMCALINDKIGWLMYLPNDEGDSFHSHNPEYFGDESATLDFVLDNGQLDYYPLSWCLPLEIINQALAYFKEHTKLPPFIVWV